MSRTFTPGASVSVATRVKVEEAARKLGYRPNAIARTMITRRCIIGVVMSYLGKSVLSGGVGKAVAAPAA